jgi:hypothetical protein
MPTHKTGSANSTRNAIIFPARVAVIPGRKTTTAMRIMVSARSRIMRILGAAMLINVFAKRASPSFLRLTRADCTNYFARLRM